MRTPKSAAGARLHFYILLISMLLPLRALAVLGERVESVAKVQAALRATSLKSAQKFAGSANFSVHEMQVHGTVVREFANADGKVFAVSWRGRTRPNLSVLLGDYAAEADQAEKADPNSRILRHPGMLKSDNLKFYRAGHMGDLRGIVILKSQAPTGVTLEDLK